MKRGHRKGSVLLLMSKIAIIKVTELMVRASRPDRLTCRMLLSLHHHKACATWLVRAYIILARAVFSLFVGTETLEGLLMWSGVVRLMIVGEVGRALTLWGAYSYTRLMRGSFSLTITWTLLGVSKSTLMPNSMAARAELRGRHLMYIPGMLLLELTRSGGSETSFWPCEINNWSTTFH